LLPVAHERHLHTAALIGLVAVFAGHCFCGVCLFCVVEVTLSVMPAARESRVFLS
jgi:hypothetical protein